MNQGLMHATEAKNIGAPSTNQGHTMHICPQTGAYSAKATSTCIKLRRSLTGHDSMWNCSSSILRMHLRQNHANKPQGASWRFFALYFASIASALAFAFSQMYLAGFQNLQFKSLLALTDSLDIAFLRNASDNEGTSAWDFWGQRARQSWRDQVYLHDDILESKTRTGEQNNCPSSRSRHGSTPIWRRCGSMPSKSATQDVSTVEMIDRRLPSLSWYSQRKDMSLTLTQQGNRRTKRQWLLMKMARNFSDHFGISAIASRLTSLFMCWSIRSRIWSSSIKSMLLMLSKLDPEMLKAHKHNQTSMTPPNASFKHVLAMAGWLYKNDNIMAFLNHFWLVQVKLTWNVLWPIEGPINSNVNDFTATWLTEYWHYFWWQSTNFKVVMANQSMTECSSNGQGENECNQSHSTHCQQPMLRPHRWNVSTAWAWLPCVKTEHVNQIPAFLGNQN